MLNGPDATAAATLLALLAGGKGLFAITKKLKGKLPRRAKEVKPGVIEIEFDEGSLEVPVKVLDLYRDVSVRETLERIVAPLDRDGIDEFIVRSPVTPGTVAVYKDEREYFKAPEAPEELIIESKFEAAYSIISLSFKETNRWRLFDGVGQISATIEDEDFLRRVNANEIAFAKGDVLVCEVVVRQYQGTGGLKTTHTVTKVVDHRRGPRQIPMSFD